MGLRCTLLGSPWLSIREAVFTVSPNKQYRGILYPTTPAKTGPVWIPTLICTERTGLKRDHQIPLLLLLRYNLHKIKKTSRYLAPTVWQIPLSHQSKSNTDCLHHLAKLSCPFPVKFHLSLQRSPLSYFLSPGGIFLFSNFTYMKSGSIFCFVSDFIYQNPCFWDSPTLYVSAVHSFTAKYYSVVRITSQCISPVFSSRTFRLFPIWSCYEHSHTDLFVDIHFSFFLGKYLEMELLNHKDKYFFPFCDFIYTFFLNKQTSKFLMNTLVRWGQENATTEWFRQQKFTFSQLWSLEMQVKVSASLILRSLSLACSWLPFCCVLSVSSLCVHILGISSCLQIFLLIKYTSQIGVELTLTAWLWCVHLLYGPVCQCSPIQSPSWGSRD